MRHRIFVANRFAKILDVSIAHDWNCITSADNPADDGPRGYEVKQLNCSSRWLNGPFFLHLQKSEGPSQDILKARNSNVLIVHALQTIMHSANKFPIDFARFSNWNCLVRFPAYCLFFLDCLKKTEQLLIAQTSHTGLQVPHRRCSKSELETRFCLYEKARRYLRQTL